jgi:uncharacterized SAM-binding protein YcdF (DUF218 family)
MQRLLSLILVLLLGYVGITHAQVWLSSSRDEARPAGAIVVLGAAQYDGRPSPVLMARLDHAVALYQEGLAPLIVVTGSKRPGDRVTEASASATYLHANGIPDDRIRREVQGTNTYDQIAASRRLLRSEGVEDAILVSDPLHSHRLALTARELGLDAHVSPRTVSVATTGERVRSSVRETVAVAAGRLTGFRRLRNLQGELRAAPG